MENAKIKTEVNVSLNQNDIVELMLEEQVEQNENRAAGIKKEISSLEAQYTDYQDELVRCLLDSNGIRNKAIYKKFAEASKVLDLKVVSSGVVLYEKEKIGSINRWDFRSFANQKHPMAYFRNRKADFEANPKDRYNFKELVINLHLPTEIQTAFRSENDNKSHSINVEGPRISSLKLNKKANGIIRAMRKNRENVLEQEIILDECTENLFTLEHDTKRNKNKFIKGILANSDTGKELVGLMAGIKNANLLEIGTK